MIELTLVFLIIPLVGVTAYVCLCVQMRRRAVPEPPYLTYFFLFAHGGIWLLLLLTTVLGGWSGMSSLGIFYLMFVSPFPAGAFAFALHDVRRDSAFRRWAYRLCLVHLAIVLALLAGFFTCTIVGC